MKNLRLLRENKNSHGPAEGSPRKTSALALVMHARARRLSLGSSENIYDQVLPLKCSQCRNGKVDGVVRGSSADEQQFFLGGGGIHCAPAVR